MDESMLKFCFKGERKYVHGTDIFNGLMKHLSETLKVSDLVKIDVTFHKQAGKNLLLEHHRVDMIEKPPEACVVFKCESQGERHWVVLTEADEAINCRYPYDEDSLVAKCVIIEADNSIRLAGGSPFTLIETIVSMNKALHLATILVRGKWLFVRAQFERWEEQRAAEVTMKIVSNFNNKLTKSDVLIDGQRMGSIYFSLTE